MTHQSLRISCLKSTVYYLHFLSHFTFTSIFDGSIISSTLNLFKASMRGEKSRWYGVWVLFLAVCLTFVISTLAANSASNAAVILHEVFEDNVLDSRISIETVGSFNSSPGIKSITNFGSTKSFGFGRSTCGASCFDDHVTSFIITFPEPIYVSDLYFKEMELYSNWGSSGDIYIDGSYLTESDFGRSPSNDWQADTIYREHIFSVNQTATTIELRVRDITNKSEIFIDDLVIYTGVGIQPEKGGDTGTVSVRIFGNEFMQGATVNLIKDGEPDIVGNSVTVSESGTSITTTFDLTGKSLGLWDVVVTNPDGTSFTLPEGFTIEKGRAAQVWVDIIGRDAIRVGREQTYNIMYGNRGNVDALAVPLWIGGIPNDAVWKLSSELSPPSVVGLEDIEWTEIPIQISRPDETILPFFVSRIPPGVTRSLTFSITMATNQDLTLRA